MVDCKSAGAQIDAKQRRLAAAFQELCKKEGIVIPPVEVPDVLCANALVWLHAARYLHAHPTAPAIVKQGALALARYQALMWGNALGLTPAEDKLLAAIDLGSVENELQQRLKRVEGGQARAAAKRDEQSRALHMARDLAAKGVTKTKPLAHDLLQSGIERDVRTVQEWIREWKRKNLLD